VLALVTLGALTLAAGAVTALGRGQHGRDPVVLKKFTLVLTNPVVAQAVIGKRIEEFSMMRRALGGSPQHWLLGRGLGYVYRDPGALYFREDPRDRERLAMFGHNYPMWLVTKNGMIGASILVFSMLFILRPDRWREGAATRLGFGLFMLVVSSLSLGSLENVPGALVLGLGLGALSLEEGPRGSGIR
jgi:hypothetical protein